MSVLLGHPAPGTCTVRFESTGRLLRVRCDVLGHRLVVSDEEGQVLHVFGGRGRQAGQLDTPLDVVAVRPEFAGERLPSDSSDAVWLAVADYGNRRVQIFELDGSVVGAIATDGPDGAIWTPTGLGWRSPVLEIDGIEGARTAVHLSAALLAAGTPVTGRVRVLPRSEARH